MLGDFGIVSLAYVHKYVTDMYWNLLNYLKFRIAWQFSFNQNVTYSSISCLKSLFRQTVDIN